MDTNFHKFGYQKREFLSLVKKNFGPEDRKKILAAFAFAQHAHKGQKRREGTAYIIHPIRIAIILLDDVGTWDADMIVAALLHDTVEDCAVSFSVVQKQFGKRVRSFVEALTRNRIANETEEQKEKDKMDKLTKLAFKPIEIRIIKCADVLDNMRSAADIHFYSYERQEFPRWQREFQYATMLSEHVHPVLFRQMKSALRTFELKRFMRGVIRLGR